MQLNLDGGSVRVVSAPADELVNREVVSEVVLLLLFEETTRGGIAFEEAGTVAPRTGTSRVDPEIEVEWGKVLAGVFRGGGLTERSG